MPVKSTYNFVPAPNENEVYKPDWANEVSHDIPFSDGESGEIELTITAETPIFIRNGHSKKDKDIFDQYIENKDKNPNYTPDTESKVSIDRYLSFSYSEVEQKYFIPGSSLKGMFRNVLEIITNSKLNKDLVNDNRYAFRDLTNGSLYLSEYQSDKVECGWLKEDNLGNWTIHCCGKPIKVSHQEIDRFLPTNFREIFKDEIYRDISNLQVDNYNYRFSHNGIQKILNKQNYTVKGNIVSKKLNSKLKIAKGKYDLLIAAKKPILNTITKDNVTGILVFTGQSSLRNDKEESGKNNEFIFPVLSENEVLVVHEKLQKDFKFIYLDHDKLNISKDWAFWKRKLKDPSNSLGIPVFFTRLNNEVQHFGLSFMYKLPFKNSIHETFPLKEYGNEKDLAETIFGYTDKFTNSIKGRVQVSNSFSNNAEQTGDIEKEILSNPKASYFPFYLRQPEKIKDRYVTYQNDATIRGFKRYPIQNGIQNVEYDKIQLSNNKIFSYFKPLKTGSIFSCKIRFHNLRKVEIGALLSCITFHGNSTKFSHSIGGAKPYGYGKIKTEISNLKFLKFPINEYLLSFENLMSNDWLNSLRVKGLLAMATVSSEDLTYPKIKDFVGYKNSSQKEILEEFPSDKIKILSTMEKKILEDKIMKDGLKLTAENIKDLVKEVNESILILGHLPNHFVIQIGERIKQVFRTHRESRKRMSKDFEVEHIWRVEIKKWLGETKAKELYLELTNPEREV
jgi:CRISPR-associated protein (TIGR03986 family)